MVEPYEPGGGAPLELPAGLVEDILRKNDEAGPALVGAIEQVQAARGPAREWLSERKMIRPGPREDAPVPTACGVDGSYVIDCMLSVSIAACAAVASRALSRHRRTGCGRSTTTRSSTSPRTTRGWTQRCAAR